MDNNIDTKVEDLRRGNNLTKMTRFEDEDQDKSGGLEERQDSDKEQQDHRRGKTGVDTLSNSQRKRLRKKKRGREMRNRDQEEDQVGDHESNRKEEEDRKSVV